MCILQSREREKRLELKIEIDYLKKFNTVKIKINKIL